MVSKNRKLVWLKLSKTARPLETSAHANFPLAENAAYQCTENGGGKTFPHCQVCGSLCVSGTMLRQSQGPRRVPREHAVCFLSVVRHTNAEQRYREWGN